MWLLLCCRYLQFNEPFTTTPAKYFGGGSAVWTLYFLFCQYCIVTFLCYTAAQHLLQLISALMETLTRAMTGLCWASLFDGANQDHDYYLARAASLQCLETCFPKETTEGQLLSAELFSLLCMCVLAVCLWPTDPEQQHEMGLPALPPLLFSLTLLLRRSMFTINKATTCALNRHKIPYEKSFGCKLWF